MHREDPATPPRRSYRSPLNFPVEERKEPFVLREKIRQLKKELAEKNDWLEANEKERETLKKQLLEKKTSDYVSKQRREENQELIQKISDLRQTLAWLKSRESALVSKEKYTKLEVDYIRLETSYLALNQSLKKQREVANVLADYSKQIRALQEIQEKKEQQLLTLQAEKEQLMTAKEQVMTMEQKDVTDLLYRVKDQAKDMVHAGEEEAEMVLSDASNYANVLQRKADKLYGTLENLATQSQSVLTQVVGGGCTHFLVK